MAHPVQQAVQSVFSRHQYTARRSTHRGTGQALSKPDPFRSKSIDIGRLDVGIAHAGQFEIPQLVGHDVDDVGLVRSERRVCQY